MDLLPPPDQKGQIDTDSKDKPKSSEKKEKSKFKIGLVLGLVVFLSAVAVASAYKLYQLRNEENVAPTAPKQAPAAENSPVPDGGNNCQLSFTIPSPTVTPEASLTPTSTPEVSLTPTATPKTPTSTPTNTPVPTVTPTGTLAPTNTPTLTSTSTPTETIAQTSYTPTPTKIELPEAGVTFPSQLLIVLGSIISLSGLLLIF